MKARPRPFALSLGCAWLTLAAAASDPPHVFVDPADPALAAIRRQGEYAIDHASNALLLIRLFAVPILYYMMNVPHRPPPARPRRSCLAPY